MSDYSAFLASKRGRDTTSGREVDPGELHPRLKPFQRALVARAVRGGRHGLWTTTGTGKTATSLSALRCAIGEVGAGLVVAPLAVCQQTIREGALLEMDVQYAPDGDAIHGPGVWITNPERVDRMPPGRDFHGMVLDEGSILRDATGKTTKRLTEHFAATPFRLSCTATPAPNDSEELTNQSAFLGIMSRVDMLASFFVHDNNSWRVKGHAEGPMARWMAGWATAMRKPSDLGDYSDEGYDLSGMLDVVPEIVEADVAAEGQLFATDLGGVGGRARTRKATKAARVARAVELVEAEPDEPWLLWCGLNDEADALAAAIPGAVNVTGSMSPEEKAEKLLGFADGHFRVLITKPSIAGRGLNFQRCARMAFVGLTDSFEDVFQCIRRCLRYGQMRVVRAHIVLSEIEQQISANVARKQWEHDRRIDQLVIAMRRHENDLRAAA